MKLDILTPEKRIFEGEAQEIQLLTRDGYIAVLSNHTPLVSAVLAGEITVKTKQGDKVFLNESGVLQTVDNKTVVLLRKCSEK